MNFKKRVNGSWVDTPNYIHKTDTDTITTLPAVIYPTDTTATVGLKGNTIQDGTPSPDMPVEVVGCGERTGNLCSNIAYKTNYSINAQGVETATFGFNIYSIFCSSNTTYTISLKSSHSGSTVRIHAYDNGVWVEQTKTDEIQYMPFTFTTPNNVDEIRVSISNVTNDEIMLNLGSTPLPYEPYGYKIPISSANTTTPVYLGEVETTRKIMKLVLTGEEIIGLYTIATGNLFRIELPTLRIQGQFALAGRCSHYRPVILASDRVDGTISGGDALSVQGVVDIVDNYATVEDFKAYLQQQYAAGTPVTVWYGLATEETAVVNEPLMKIGDYADEVANVSIPVAAGGDTLSVDTTVQPSEVTVNYKGWHETTVKEWDGSQWS